MLVYWYRDFYYYTKDSKNTSCAMDIRDYQLHAWLSCAKCCTMSTDELRIISCMLGYLDGITGEYTTPEGYFVDEQDAEEFDKHFS